MVAAAPWLSRPWRRASWAMLLLIAAARLITGGLLQLQLVLALAAGVTVGAGLLVVFGVPDRRMGTAGVAAALCAGGVPVSPVTGPLRAAKGSRPFEATTGDGNGLFVKVFGSDQRDAPRRPIVLQRWSVRRVTLAAAMLAIFTVPAVFGIGLLVPSGAFTGHAPDCGPGHTMILAAQAVPSAAFLPCIAALPSGWTTVNDEIVSGRASFGLDSGSLAGGGGVRFVLG